MLTESPWEDFVAPQLCKDHSKPIHLESQCGQGTAKPDPEEQIDYSWIYQEQDIPCWNYFFWVEIITTVL